MANLDRQSGVAAPTSLSRDFTFGTLFCWQFVAAICFAPPAANAETWEANAGAQTTDKGVEVFAFLANELWIHVDDSIRWTFPTSEFHTVTFLKPGQIRPPRPLFGGSCPGITPDGSSFDGSACLTSPELVHGQTYTVTFPKTGNFKLVCLLHANMSGAVHVLDGSAALPHDQAFYDQQGRREQAQLLANGASLQGRGLAAARRVSANEVTGGIGEIVATGGGSHTISVMRFLQGTIDVEVGDTVEWTNLDPVTPHTVTFGTEPPANHPQPPSANVTVDADGARHALVGSPADSVHSGFLVAAPQDRATLAQSNLGVTRFRVTFSAPGTFDYICSLHDDFGMVGRVIVHP